MTRTGWQALRRGAWSGDVLALKREQPAVFGTWAWLHQCPLMGPVPGVLVSSAVSLPALLASHLVETPEEIAGHLTELERRGLVVIEGSDLYLPALLQDTASAPTSKNQIPSWSRQVLKLGPVLRARVSADLLDVTMRADDERGRRRKDDAVPIYQRLQEALGVRLHALPDLPQEPQLSLSLPTERPEVRIVKDDTPVETGAFVDFLDAATMNERTPAETAALPAPGRDVGAPLMAERGDRLPGERRQGGNADRNAAQATLLRGVQAEGAQDSREDREGHGVREARPAGRGAACKWYL